MKRKLLALLLALSILPTIGVAPVKATLYSCFQQNGMQWSSVEERAILAAQNGIFGYVGTAQQNKQLEDIVCGSEGLVGFSVATGYQKTVRTSMTAVQTTVPVTSLTLKDGTVLSMSSLGSKVFLTLEPGKTKEEIVSCTGITTSTLTFTGCTRGLAFSGTSTVAVSANQKTHNAGSVVVMSNVHYVYDELADKEDSENIGGIKTFTSGTIRIGSNTTTVSSSVLFYNGIGGFIDHNGTNLRWSNDGVNVYTFSSSSFTVLSASSTRGIFVTDSQIGINASSTSGLLFDSSGNVYIVASSTGGITANTGGLALDLSDPVTWNAVWNFTTTTQMGFASTTPSEGKVPIDTGKRVVWLRTTSTPATGDIVRFNGTDWERIATGTLNQSLVSGSSTPYWAYPPGYVSTFQAPTTTSFTTTTNSYTLPLLFDTLGVRGVGAASTSLGNMLELDSAGGSGRLAWPIMAGQGTLGTGSSGGNPSDVFWGFSQGRSLSVLFKARFQGNSGSAKVGMSDFSKASNTDCATNVAANRDNNAVFCWDGGALYAFNSSGSQASSTQITGYTASTTNIYGITFNPGSSIQYSINGNIVATQTSNLPTSTLSYFGATVTSGASTTVAFPTFTQEL